MASWNPVEDFFAILHGDDDSSDEGEEFLEDEEYESDSWVYYERPPENEVGVGAGSSPVRERSPLRERSPVRDERPSFGLLIDEPDISRGGQGGRAGARRGRGGGGRGRGRDGARRGRGGNTWQRGDPLVPVFISDEDLPEDLRHEIDSYIASQLPRGRGAGEAVDEEAEAYYDAEEFVWESMDSSTNSSIKETFRVECPGPTRSYDNSYDAFRAYWDDDILDHIVTETNEYARGIQSARFQSQWYETTRDEILKLFSFWMMLGVIQMPSITSCFSTNPLLKTEIFRSLFKRDRYWNLSRAFHLAPRSDPANPDPDVLSPIRHVLNHFNTKFQDAYRPHQNISIDESLTLWKGPCKFKQYIKTKSAKFEIKTQQLCESATGYLWSFFVYIGAATTTSPLPSSTSTVLQLVEPLLNLGYTLFMDNWFSPRLARYLKRRGTDCVGTLRANRRDVPRIIQKAPLVEGEFVARTSGDVRVVALQDRKRLSLISTFHDLSQVQIEARPGHPAQYRLQLVDDYNHAMGGVHGLDQMLEPYLVERKKCRDWTRKLFKRILNASIQNARILVEGSTNSKIDSLVFRLSLVQSILEMHGPHQPALDSIPRQNALSVGLRSLPAPRNHNFPPSRLTSRCFMRKIPDNEGHESRRRCVVCSLQQLRRRTRYWCPTCEAALCVDNCFEDFHTVVLGR